MRHEELQHNLDKLERIAKILDCFNAEFSLRKCPGFIE